MNMDRRAFLSLGIGSAAGIMLSPLPWKLMDDSAIWTQAWPWTPVPPKGEATYVNSACTLCPGGCGISVRKINGRAVKIEGIKGHPVNDGGICALGLSGLQLLYGPARIKSPLKRVGERGAGKWSAISWEEAIAEVAQKLGDLRKNGESGSVSCISGKDNGTVPALFKRFLSVCGSSGFMKMPSVADSYGLAVFRSSGLKAQLAFDIKNSGYILSFGSGIVEGWGSPVHMIRANSIFRKAGGKIMQIEPRLSNTAAKSDKWIPINPGTEYALALGIANVIIAKSLFNKDFTYNNISGFAEFAAFVQSFYSPDNVENITGIKKETIEAIALEFAAAAKPLAVCGRGQGRAQSSLGEIMAVQALNALVGNINKKGGVFIFSGPGYFSLPGFADQAAKPANSFADNVNSGKYTANVLFVYESNPLYSLADSNSVRKAFAKIPFIVSFSSFMDETATNSDLILPNHVYLERYEDVYAASLQKPVVSLSSPVINPQFDTKHAGDAILQIAKKMGSPVANSFMWNSYDSYLEEAFGDNWKVLSEQGFMEDRALTPAALETTSIKFDFKAGFSDFKSLYTVLAAEGEPDKYPLLLIPYDSLRIASGYIGDPPFAVKTVEDTMLKGNDGFVEINPITAKALGFLDENYAIIETARGKAKVKIHLFEGIMPGLVAMPRGLGHSAYDNYLAGKGVNVNELIGGPEDPASGLDAGWGIRACLIKA
ncbi:MAG: menaquinone reductase molybdopterin-binding-like subunit QrcB [Desulfobacterales bacterium]